MKLLIVGSDMVWSLERIYLKHFKELGTEVNLFAAQNIFYKYYGKHFLNKVLFRLGFSSIYSSINRQLLAEVESLNPDWILFFKGMEIFPETLVKIKKKGIRIANYNPDNPFLFSGSGSGNKNVTDSISLYDVHFTYDRGIQRKIVDEYHIPCRILPFGFEVTDEQIQKCNKTEEINRICFVGNPDEYRAKFLNDLASDFTIDVFGHHWERFVKHQNINIFPPAYGDDYWTTIYKYRVQLNLMRPHNPASHNMRSFEVPGIGGVGLYPDTIDHREFFREKGIAFTYSEINDCKKICSKLLGMNLPEIELFRKQAREKSTQFGYNYASRTKQVANILSEL